MKLQLEQFFRAVILAAFGLFLIKLHITGEIYQYINPKYEMLSQIAAGLFIFFFFIQLARVWERKHVHHCDCGHGCDHDHGGSTFSKKLINYLIIMFPLVTGFSIAPTMLDASIAEKKGVMLQGNTAQEQDAVEDNIPSTAEDVGAVEDYNYEEDLALPNNNYVSQEQYDEQLNILHKENTIHMEPAMFEPYYEKVSMDPHAYAGKQMVVSGFIYKEKGFQPNQLVVSRYLITHCVADASIIGFLAEFNEDVGQIDQDAWIELEGTVTVGNYLDIELPIIQVKNWKVIEKPKEQYVYPVLTKVVE